MPFTFYFPKSKWGIDLAAKSDVAPKFKNAEVRFGIYVPLTTGDEGLTIEPLVRFKKLERKDLSFKEDKLVFGFSLSFKLPEFVTNKKK